MTLAVRPRRDAGFTLLELLVVITILVVLTVAVGSVSMNYLGRGRADATRIQLTQVQTGLDLFRLDAGRYPTDAEGLDALVEAPGALRDRWNGPYVKGPEMLQDAWGNPLEYAIAGSSYSVLSLGSDGMIGGDGDAADVAP